MHLHLEKEAAKSALSSALLRMLIVMREEHGDYLDGVAADISLSPTGDLHGNLAALVGDSEYLGESL